MEIIGRTVQVTAGEAKRGAAIVCAGEDKGQTGTVLAWIKQVGMPDARTPDDRRWLVSVRREDIKQTVNYYPHELALDDGGAVPLQPDADETPEG